MIQGELLAPPEVLCGREAVTAGQGHRQVRLHVAHAQSGEEVPGVPQTVLDAAQDGVGFDVSQDEPVVLGVPHGVVHIPFLVEPGALHVCRLAAVLETDGPTAISDHRTRWPKRTRARGDPATQDGRHESRMDPSCMNRHRQLLVTGHGRSLLRPLATPKRVWLLAVLQPADGYRYFVSEPLFVNLAYLSPVR